MDEYEDLIIPGAKWLKIVFDKQSSSEKDCDYVEFFRDQTHNEKWGSRYSGPKSSSSKYWAGVDGVPAVIIESDRY